MLGIWGKKKADEDAGVSADFRRALTQEVMGTELLRIKALIATAVLLGVIVAYRLLLRNRGGQPRLARQSHAALSLCHYRTVHPVRIVGARCRSTGTCGGAATCHCIRRYLGALIETSMPTVALALHIDSMGSVAALGFVAPMIYFIFIILSTLRLDFWLSTFTGCGRRHAAVLHGDVLSSGRSAPSRSRSSITPRAA